MPEMLEERPPFVRFVIRAVEDRDASIREGHFMSKDVIMAEVTPVGGKDTVIRVADEWLQQLARDVQEQRFPPAWHERLKQMLAAFKEGQELPEDGIPIKTWPPLNPAMRDNLIQLHIRTVEDLAQLTEEGIARLGMGARSLKQQARDWLENAKTGRAAVELSALRVELENAKTDNATLREQNVELAAEIKKMKEDIAAMARAKK